MLPKVRTGNLPYRLRLPEARDESRREFSTDFAAWCWVGMVVTVLLRLLVMLG